MNHTWQRALLFIVALWLMSFPAPDLTARPVEYLIQFRADWESSGDVAQFMDAHGLRAISHIPRINVWVVTSRAGASAIQEVAQSDQVAWIEPNGLVRMSGTIPNDYWWSAQQEYLALMGLPDAWAVATGNAQPIAIVDTGIYTAHPDLVAKIWTNQDEVPDNGVDDDSNGYVDDVHGWNFVRYSNQPQDDQGHGSHVAGIAAASTDNGIGIAGMSWQATIMPVKVLDNRGEGTFADLAAGIIYAADKGAPIINLSLGSTLTSTTVAQAVSYAQSKGCLLIAAAGNQGISPVEFPASLPGVVAVAATTSQDTRWLNSNYGSEVTVSAPGENIISASHTGSYFFQSGTSMSVAHVSGLAALVWSVRPDFSSQQVARIITETAHDVALPGWDVYTGWGRIDAYQAVHATALTRCFLPIILR